MKTLKIKTIIVGYRKKNKKRLRELLKKLMPSEIYEGMLAPSELQEYLR